MDLRVENKNVLVTGGSKNLGKAIVKEFLLENANVVFTYCHDDDKAKATHEELARYSKNVFTYVKADAMDESRVRMSYEFCEERMGPVDILINNACQSVKRIAMVQDMTDEMWNEDLFGAILPMYLYTRMLCCECIENHRKCHIVNIGAREGNKIFSVPGMSAYASAKAGVMMYTRTLAYQMAPYGIIINGLVPGLALDEDAKSDPDYAHIFENKKMGPHGKPADAGDIAKLAVYLSSDYANYIVGANVDITGGNLL